MASRFAGAQETVRVAAAANVSSVAPSLSAAFARKYPAYRLEFTSGPRRRWSPRSSTARPFRSFFPPTRPSPGNSSMRRTDGPVKVYAVGTLIFLTTKDLDLSKGLALLADPSVAHFANCNPETAPYGRAARRPSSRPDSTNSVKSKLVMAQTSRRPFNSPSRARTRDS